MNGCPIKKQVLVGLYTKRRLSAMQISKRLDTSAGRVNYWLARHGIHKRNLHDAAYVKHNPKGDPFAFLEPKSHKDILLFGIALGLYWGEGTKASRTAVRLGNTDPDLIKAFLRALIKIYRVERHKIKFGLQIFSDMDPYEALDFWVGRLGFARSHFGRVIVTPARSIGTYRHKTQHGVLTVYVLNSKLRNLINEHVEKYAKLR